MATQQECISTVIEKMNNEEKGILKCMLLYGKKLNEDEDPKTMFNSIEALNKCGEDVTLDWVSAQLEDIFTLGFGFMDILKDISFNYGKQLDIVIKKVLVESLKVSKPIFSKNVDTIEGAIQRERWIAEQLMNSIVMNMDEDVKRVFIKQIAEILKEKGIDPTKAINASAALLTGGLTAAKTVMGFGFHTMVATVANLIVKTLVGRGLSVAANATLQRMGGMLFGPIGWAITAIFTIPLITSFINPRGYDKYIPAIFVIGVTRLSQNNDEEKTQSI